MGRSTRTAGWRAPWMWGVGVDGFGAGVGQVDGEAFIVPEHARGVGGDAQGLIRASVAQKRTSMGWPTMGPSGPSMLPE